MTLQSVLGLFARRWLPLVLCLIAGVGGAVAHAVAVPKVYKSSARLFVNIPAAASTQEALQGTQLSAQLIQSYADIVTSRTAAQQIKDTLGLPDSVSAIAGKLSATPQPNSLILTIGATDPNRARAQAIANAAATVLNDTIQTLEKNRTPASQVEATIVDKATLPGSPVSPKPLRDLLLGLVLGILGGLGLALLLDALDRTVKLPLDIERVLGAPGLGIVPQTRTSRASIITTPKAPAAVAEAYRSLRTSLRFLDPDHPTSSLVVTSPSDGEGKTTTAFNLAHSLAHSGVNVILVDADLRSRGLTHMLGAESAIGLTSVLTGGMDLDATLGMQDGAITVLPAGPVPPNPAELLGSQRMATLIDELTQRADIVVFDAPPALQVTDAVVLATQADGVAMVVRYGRTSRTAAAETARRLASVDARLLGFVLQGAPKSKDKQYGVVLPYGDLRLGTTADA